MSNVIIAEFENEMPINEWFCIKSKLAQMCQQITAFQWFCKEKPCLAPELEHFVE